MSPVLIAAGAAMIFLGIRMKMCPQIFEAFRAYLKIMLIILGIGMMLTGFILALH